MTARWPTCWPTGYLTRPRASGSWSTIRPSSTASRKPSPQARCLLHDFHDGELVFASIARRPRNRLALSQADQRGTDRRHHRDLVRVAILVDRIAQRFGPLAAVVRPERHC